MNENSLIDVMIEKSRKAQLEFEKFTQEQIDKCVKIIAKVVFDNAEEFARMAVAETRMGNYEDKLKKKLGKSRIIWHSLKNKKSVGILEHDEKTKITLVAKPVGIVGAVTPCTNPVVTPMCNAMFALKGGNSIIIAPHPRAKKCGKYFVDLCNEKLSAVKVPENLIQIIEEPTIELTNELMRKVDVVVATGGMGIVKAAYSSGKPSFGVGVGNVQVIMDRDIDIKDTVSKIIAGRAFDNGIICSAEQTVMVPDEKFDEIVNEFKNNGCHFISGKEEKQRLRDALFINGVPNKDVIGQAVSKIAEIAKIDIPSGTKVIVVETDGIGKEDVFCKEKMCPVIALIRYRDFAEAVRYAQANLDFEGKGHSVSVHSGNKENIEYAALNVKVSRILINQICATSNGGSFFNGLAATTTLGCGSWGNNSISENFDYKHLLNISRIAYFNESLKAPSDEELWGDSL